MKDHDKQIQDWQEHLRASFADESKLVEYLFTTMDNFYYRYLETSTSKNLKTTPLKERTYGALSFEPSMVEALKNPAAGAKAGIIDLAKSVPRDLHPAVRFGLWVEVDRLTSEKGHLVFTAEINWDFPDYQESSKRVQKRVEFTYSDLAQFRKELALKLEAVCELF